MGQDPSVIRAEIEETRGRVGQEVDALSYKTDVGARMGDYVDEKKEAVRSKVTGAKDKVAGNAGTLKRTTGHVRDTAEGNPLGLAIGGLAAGFLLGTLLPKTRIEDERLGEMSDRVTDAVKETATEAVDRGKQVAQDAASSALDAAKESGREQGDQLSSHLQERAQESTPTSQSS
jgi:hypothetical protein